MKTYIFCTGGILFINNLERICKEISILWKGNFVRRKKEEG
jgi:hypothetical protein